MTILKPAELLEEMLRFREATPKDTASFKDWNHDDLCLAFETQINIIGDSFLKYHHVTYNVQGPRDQGVDVLLKSNTQDSYETYVGIQVKSYKELEDNTLSKNLKSAYHDARNHYGSRLARYYIALCGDSRQHARRISAITNEFSKESRVRMIGPRYLYTFLTMSEHVLSAKVDRFLTPEDEVRKVARSEVSGLDESEVYFVLLCLAQYFETGVNRLPPGFFERSDRYQEMSDSFGHQKAEDVLNSVYDQVIEIQAAGDETRVRNELYPAINALYLDFRVRYDEPPDELFLHLYNFLIL